MKKYIFKSPVLFMVSIIFMIIDCIMGTFFSIILGRIVDAASIGMPELIRMFVIGLIFTVTYVIVTILAGVTKNRFIGNNRTLLKNELFKNIFASYGKAYSEVNTAEYINDMTNNLSIYENSYIGNIYTIVTLAAMFVSASIVTIMVEPIMLVIMIVLAVITAVVSANIGKPIEKKTTAFMQNQSDYVAELKDDFSAFYLIKTFNVLKSIITKHGNKNKMTEDSKVSVGISQVLCQGIGQFVGLLSTVGVMAIAAYFVIKGRFSVGMVIAFGSLIGQIISPISGIPDVMANAAAAKPIISRFKEILGAEENTGNKTKTDFNDKLTLNNISFSYNDKKVLKDINFTFEKGKKYAIIGANGSGKTTLINIISGLLKDYTGTVKYDEDSISELSRESISKLVSVVAQETFLFNDTIRNNITLFEGNYDDESIKKALSDAGLTKLVEKLPQGLDTVVEENGKNFSGGERQRLSIARALLRKCPILILDEGTSAVDAENAADIEERLLKDPDITLIEITHNITDEHIARFDSTLKI